MGTGRYIRPGVYLNRLVGVAEDQHIRPAPLGIGYRRSQAVLDPLAVPVGQQDAHPGQGDKLLLGVPAPSQSQFPRTAYSGQDRDSPSRYRSPSPANSTASGSVRRIASRSISTRPWESDTVSIFMKSPPCFRSDMPS